MFEQSYAQLYTAMYDRKAYKNTVDLDLKRRYYLQYETLLLGSVHCTYDMLKANAIESGNIIQREGLFYASENVNEAFEQKTSCLAAIQTKSVIAGKTYTLRYDPNFVLEEDRNKSIQNITVQTSNETVTLGVGNAAIWVAPADTGIQYISYIIHFNDGSQKTTTQRMVVIDGGFQTLNTVLTHQSCEVNSYDLEANIPYLNIKGRATISIFYHSSTTNSLQCERKLKKPIILLDGIDNLNDGEIGRNAKKIYAKYLYYMKGADSIQVGDSLRMMGYDIIVMDPILYNAPNGDEVDGGDDYMQRNAMILVKLIQNIKDSLVANGSSEKLIVVGPSMGGQVSRYALLYMEKQLALTNDQVWNPKCRLWVAFDSPNDGANIALSMQQYLTFWGNKVGSAAAQKTLRNYLLAPASQQLLLHQVKKMDGTDYNKNVSSIYFNGTNPLRQDWLNEISNMGNYPTSCRKIALSNGGRQTGYFHAPASKMFEFHTNIGGSQLIGNSKNYFLPESGSSKTIFTGNLTLTSFIIPVPIFNANPNSLQNTSVYGAIDACPGSYYDVQKEFYENGTGSSWTIIMPTFSTFTNKTNNISFIPTASSVGLKNNQFNWSVSVPSENLVCDNKTYFDNYYVPQNNENHVSFTEASWKWLREEIQYGLPNCAIICATAINGIGSGLCPNQVKTVSLDVPPPPNCDVLWEVSNGITALSSVTNPSSLTVQSTGSNSNGWVKATITQKIRTEINVAVLQLF